MKDKGKVPIVNMVTTKVQQVTTQGQAKQYEWEMQEVVCKATKEWVEEANNKNVGQMLQESKLPTDNSASDKRKCPQLHRKTMKHGRYWLTVKYHYP